MTYCNLTPKTDQLNSTSGSEIHNIKYEGSSNIKWTILIKKLLTTFFKVASVFLHIPLHL